MSATLLGSSNHGTVAAVIGLSREGAAEVAGELRPLLADVLALFMKTKSFHWHMTGPHFRDYHVLLDDQSEQLFAMIDKIAERTRKIGGKTLRSVSDISRHQRLEDNNEELVLPTQMLAELRSDNQELTRSLRAAHDLCDKHRDVATASLLETWIDEAECRTWFLSMIVGES